MTTLKQDLLYTDGITHKDWYNYILVSFECWIEVCLIGEYVYSCPTQVDFLPIVIFSVLSIILGSYHILFY